ncbi:MAG: NADH-quinone oxidoreductase subunit M, partial [Nitrospinota bacterium]
MNQLGFPLLSWIVFLPLLGAAVLGFMREESERGARAIRVTAFSVSLGVFFLSLPLFFYFREDFAGMQFVERASWIPSLGISYHLGVDGISLFLVLLTTFLTPVAILASFRDIKKRVRFYYMAMLFLETGMLGVFMALDLFLFYVFWEAMLIPMYLLIGVWGGPDRIYAAIKFIIYTMVGSVLMLVAILALYFLHSRATGAPSFDLLEILKTPVALSTQYWLFGAFALAFAIKVPMFPFHTWLPDAHVEAPTAGSVILAGILLKMGTYGFLRFAIPLFPEAALFFAPLIIALAIVGIIYGALVSMVQPDLKKLVAYSSVSHLGFVMLGLFVYNAQGIEGGILQMVNHGISTGALFLIVGIVYERRHTRMIADFGGLSSVMPLFAAFFMVTTLSSIGLPGLNGFVGEFTILVGAFRHKAIYGVAAAVGVILAAVYMLWMFQRVMFGRITHEENRGLRDLTLREIFVLAPTALFMFWIGIAPKPFFSKMEASVEHLLKQVRPKVMKVEVERPPLPGLLAQRERASEDSDGSH